MPRPKSIDDESLLKIARRIFVEGGAMGSTKDIAAQAGISEAALFKRYPTKAALFLAALAPPQADTAFMLEAARAAPDARAGLHLLARHICGYFRMAIPLMLPLLSHPVIGLDELRRRFGEPQAERLASAMAQFIRFHQKRGAMRAANPTAAAGLLVAALHSVALFEMMGLHGGAVPPAALKAMVDTLWAGLAPKPKGRTA